MHDHREIGRRLGLAEPKIKNSVTLILAALAATRRAHAATYAVPPCPKSATTTTRTSTPPSRAALGDGNSTGCVSTPSASSSTPSRSSGQRSNRLIDQHQPDAILIDPGFAGAAPLLLLSARRRVVRRS